MHVEQARQVAGLFARRADHFQDEILGVGEGVWGKGANICIPAQGVGQAVRDALADVVFDEVGVGQAVHLSGRFIGCAKGFVPGRAHHLGKLRQVFFRKAITSGVEQSDIR